MTRLGGRLLSALLLALSAVLLAPASASAQELSLQAYRQGLSGARDALSSAMPRIGQAETAARVSERVEDALPSDLVVRVGSTTVDVDSSVALSLAGSLEAAATPDARRRAAARLAEHLGSLALAARPIVGQEVRHDEEALRSLLAGRGQERSLTLTELISRLVGSALSWLQERLGSLLPQRQASVLSELVLYAVVAALAGVLVWVSVRALASARRALALDRPRSSGPPRPVVPAAEGVPEDALAYAEELAQAGEYRLAVRALFGGAARRMVESGLVVQTRTLTGSELLATVRETSFDVHEPLSALSGRFELAWYGHRDPGPVGYAEARSAFAQVLKVAETV